MFEGHIRVALLVFLGGSALVASARYFEMAEALGAVFEVAIVGIGLFAVVNAWLQRQRARGTPASVRMTWEMFACTLVWAVMAQASWWTAAALWLCGLGMLWYELTLGTRVETASETELGLRAKAEIVRIEGIISHMNEASGQVRMSIDAQADSVDNQSAAIAEIATALSEINVTSQQASEQAQSVVATADTSEQISRQGIESVSQNIDGLHRISEQVEAITANIFDLNEQTNQIGEIVATSSELAERSHVLALNASVEAARSGEAGKGFQVVAQEMKNLARQSKQATERIRRILGEIQRATQQVVTATEEGSRRVTAGIHLAQQAGEIIRQLSQVITGSAHSARVIATASRQLSGGIEQISTAMGELTNLTGGIVSVGKTAEDAVRKLGALSQELTKVAEQLQSESDSAEGGGLSPALSAS